MDQGSLGFPCRFLRSQDVVLQSCRLRADLNKGDGDVLEVTGVSRDVTRDSFLPPELLYQTTIQVVYDIAQHGRLEPYVLQPTAAHVGRFITIFLVEPWLLLPDNFAVSKRRDAEAQLLNILELERDRLVGKTILPLMNYRRCEIVHSEVVTYESLATVSQAFGQQLSALQDKLAAYAREHASPPADTTT